MRDTRADCTVICVTYNSAHKAGFVGTVAYSRCQLIVMAARRKVPDRNVLVDQARSWARKTAKKQSKDTRSHREVFLENMLLLKKRQQKTAAPQHRPYAALVSSGYASSVMLLRCASMAPRLLRRRTTAGGGGGRSSIVDIPGYVRRYLGAEDDWYDRMGQRLSWFQPSWALHTLVGQI